MLIVIPPHLLVEDGDLDGELVLQGLHLDLELAGAGLGLRGLLLHGGGLLLGLDAGLLEHDADAGAELGAGARWVDFEWLSQAAFGLAYAAGGLAGAWALKAALVAAYFMHLRFDSRIFTGLFVGPLALAIAIVLALMALFGAFVVGRP
jgi:hypothetical protein